MVSSESLSLKWSPGAWELFQEVRTQPKSERQEPLRRIACLEPSMTPPRSR